MIPTDPASEVVDGIEPAFRGAIPGNVWLETLATGFRWPEGPIRVADWNCLLFQDLPGDPKLRWHPDGTAGPFRAPSHHASGQARDTAGRLVSAPTGTGASS